MTSEDPMMTSLIRYEDTSMALAPVAAAEAEWNARRFEELALQYHDARREHLESLGAPGSVAREAAAARLPTIASTQRDQLVGTTVSEDTLNMRMEAKLEQDIPERKAEMQALGPPPGGLISLSSDSNVPIAKACQMEGFPNRKFHLTASSHTRIIYGAALLPDEKFSSRREHVEDLKAQLGAPLLFFTDNLPANATEYKELYPDTTLLNDLKHVEALIKNTARSYSLQAGKQIAKLGSLYLVPRIESVTDPAGPCDGSFEWIKERLRGKYGGIRSGSKVMVEPSKSAKHSEKYFVFGAQNDGVVMPEEMIEKMTKNGCFAKTFERSLWSDWRKIADIETGLKALRDSLAYVNREYSRVLTSVRQLEISSLNTSEGSSSSSATFTDLRAAHAIIDVSAAAEHAAAAAAATIIAELPEQGDGASEQSFERLQSAQRLQRAIVATSSAAIEASAVQAARHALAPSSAALVAPAPSSTVMTLIKEERLLVFDAVNSHSGLVRALDDVGAYFNANKVLEHTWTTATIPQINLALQKIKWLDRPDSVVRYVQDGEDSRGLPTFRVVDGTNKAESAFGEIEKPLCSINGGFGQIKWQGKVLNKIGRMNERERVLQNGGKGPGHYHLQRARLHNALMEAHGEQPFHPALPKLPNVERRARTQQGVDTFHAELKRRADIAGAEAVAVNAADAITLAVGADGGAATALVATEDANVAVAVPRQVSQSSSSGNPFTWAAGSSAAEAAATEYMQPLVHDPPSKRPSEQSNNASSKRQCNEQGCREPDLAGIMPHHRTYHWGKTRQLQHNLTTGKLCADTCQAFGKKEKSLHSLGCEHDLILKAKLAYGYDRKGNIKR
jgi:hypothetical protein